MGAASHLPVMASRAVMASLDRPAQAVVVGAAGGIGGAFVDALGEAGFDSIHAFSRKPLPAERTDVRAGPIDLEDESTIAEAAATVGGETPLRLVLVATGLLHGPGLEPEKTFRTLDPEALMRSYRINAVGPALVAKHFLPLLPRQGKSVFAVLSARVGSIEDNRLGGWYGYRASKAALNQIVRTLAVELRRQKPDAICVALHPGTVDTALSRPFRSGVKPESLFEPERAANHLLAVLDGLTGDDSGHLFAWDGARIPF